MSVLTDVAHTIELSVAPVFLLAGVGAFLNVVTSRLGRAVDRARVLEERLAADQEGVENRRIRDELQVLDRRMTLAQRSIVLFCFSALLVCVLVATLFIAEFSGLPLGMLVGMLFVGAMIALIGGLALFLAEVSIATRILRVRAELIMKK